MSLDSQTWGYLQWAASAVTSVATAILGFIWATRSKLADHDRRIETIETGFSADLRRLETKVDLYHSDMTKMMVSALAQFRDE